MMHVGLIPELFYAFQPPATALVVRVRCAKVHDSGTLAYDVPG